ncbi:MAG: NAD-dependent epimerase/dehydratase, partial [Gammaproteobacteria bacterium]|nr:NAD-dependent epimerase/dehydratase [Gammaproteobacteria bacterium]
MLNNEKILITGVTGKIAFPIARDLAKRNEVWGVARLGKPGDRDKLTSAGIHPLQLDVSSGDFSAIPDDFTYVFHAAVDTGAGEWRPCVQT